MVHGAGQAEVGYKLAALAEATTRTLTGVSAILSELTSTGTTMIMAEHEVPDPRVAVDNATQTSRVPMATDGIDSSPAPVNHDRVPTPVQTKQQGSRKSQV